ILLRLPNYIRVEGHTDDLPINTPQFPSNWDLSTARANTVVKELIDGLGFPPERLAAVGYGEYRPRVPNDSDYHRQLNRRVDIVVLKTKYSGAEPAPLAPAAGPPGPPGGP
ncbi:MAG: OmpA family protein, partial [Firmicutes bacterium]|nr:OmpA family protein [Bacillota bacterium]